MKVTVGHFSGTGANYFGVTLRSIWGPFGVTWGHLGISSGSHWGN